MKKQIILPLALPLLIAPLAGCSGSALKVFKKDSRFYFGVLTNKDNPNIPLPETEENLLSVPLKTYHLKGQGDVPYVQMEEFVTLCNTASSSLHEGDYTAQIIDKQLHLYSGDKSGEYVFDAKNDVIRVKNSPSFVDRVTVNNNGIPGDYASMKAPSIKNSEKTKAFMADGSPLVEWETFELKQYGFDIYEKGSQYYVPFDLLSAIFFKDISVSFSFNGSDYFLNSQGKFINSYKNSSKGTWESVFGVFKQVKAEGGEAYRFQMEGEMVDEHNPGQTIHFSRFIICQEGSDAANFVACKGNTYDPNQIIDDPYDSNHFKYTYRVNDKIVKIRVFQGENANGDYMIHLDETNYNKGKIEKKLSAFNYNLLRFIFDNIYGLKGVKSYNSAAEYFASVGAAEGLQSLDPSVYNDAFAKLIGAVDDGHTSYSAVTPMTDVNKETSPAALIKNYMGNRLKGLMTARANYTKSRLDTWNKLHPDEPGTSDPDFHQGVKLSDDKQTAIITFDSFIHSGSVIENMKNVPQEVDRYAVRSKFVFSSTDGFNYAFRMIDNLNKGTKVTKNVVIDLTLNGGGMIATLPYLAAFFTDDPIYRLQLSTNGAFREYHYQADINGDGVYGGAGDTYKDVYNIYVMTSQFSFSCGNCLPGMAKEAGIKIIGERSGGGACPVGVYADALGTQFNLSNYLLMSHKDAQGKYYQNDSGIPLDREFPLENGSWYDPNIVNSFLKTL